MKVGNQVTRDFQKIDKGSILRLYRADCGDPSPLKALKDGSPYAAGSGGNNTIYSYDTPIRSTLPRQSLREAYNILENQYHLEIDLDNNFSNGKKFGIKNTLLRNREKIYTGCPERINPPYPTLLYWVFELDYVDGYGPNFNRGTYMYDMGTIDLGQSQGGTFASPSNMLYTVGDDHYNQFNSSGIGTVQATWTYNAPTSNDPCEEPSVDCFGNLVSFGSEYTFISGQGATPIPSIATLGCDAGYWGGWWTGVNYEFGPVGLVMSVGFYFHTTPYGPIDRTPYDDKVRLLNDF